MIKQILLLGLSLISTLADVGVVFIDNKQGKYFTPSQTQTHISPDGFVTSLASLLTLSPRYYVGSRVSQEIEALLTGDVFERPAVNVLFRVAGIQQENFTSLIGKEVSRPATFLTMTGETYQVPKAEDFKLLTEPKSSLVGVLEYTQLPDSCGAECLESALQELAPKIGATYVPAGKPVFTGKLSFKNGVELNLAYSADRFWAGEVAALYYMTKQIADSSVSGLHTRSQLIEGSFSSLKNLVNEYGGESQQVKVACVAFLDVFDVLLDMLDKAYEGRVSAQLVFLGDSSLQEVEALSVVKRKLLKKKAPELYDLQWTAQAIAIASFVVMVYFLAAGLYCLCCMKFTQDTLLYSRAKVE
eukprot:TRINITY_DN626_c0_g1_i4.p1 TRINITY_DN626_c0_g1~~TRINITY_DN626_c0_g1_i4.p1  ORF type:complete len:382 (-),score=48.65 TRINITY_DN626_c0_g1_i4:259-1332(-)